MSLDVFLLENYKFYADLLRFMLHLATGFLTEVSLYDQIEATNLSAK